MRKKSSLFILLAFALAGLSAVGDTRYNNFNYSAVVRQDACVWDMPDKPYTVNAELPENGTFNVYIELNSTARHRVNLSVNGKPVPALELPRAGLKDNDFRRLKLAAGVPLISGTNQLEIRAIEPWKGIKIKNVMFERVVEPHPWQLVWVENFNENGLPDSTHWRTETGLLRNQELQYYTGFRPENIAIKDGLLVITAIREKIPNAKYNPQSKDWRFNRKESEFSSAVIDTFGLKAWQYGKIEARLKVTGGIGRWPAFWTMGESIYTEGWPKCGEIDIMEFFGKTNNRITNAAHFWFESKNVHKSCQDWNVKTKDNSPIEDAFHVYSVVWDENRIEWFIDNNKTFELKRQDGERWCFDNPQYVILNLALGSVAGKVPDNVNEVKYFVDYVKVYQ